MLPELANFIQQPDFPLALQKFISLINNPSSATSNSESDLPEFRGWIHVHHSALATYFTPSDLCGAGGMQQERIHSVPSWYDHPHRNTVFVVLDDSLPGFEDLVIACILLFFSFHYKQVHYSCAYVNWFVCSDNECDHDTCMWNVSLEKHCGKLTSQVIDMRTIARTTHLIPVYGSGPVPPEVNYHNSLDMYQSFFVNAFADHHSFEFLSD
jgi:hypothetical protein